MSKKRCKCICPSSRKGREKEWTPRDMKELREAERQVKTLEREETLRKDRGVSKKEIENMNKQILRMENIREAEKRQEAIKKQKTLRRTPKNDEKKKNYYDETGESKYLEMMRKSDESYETEW